MVFISLLAKNYGDLVGPRMIRADESSTMNLLTFVLNVFVEMNPNGRNCSVNCFRHYFSFDGSYGAIN